MPYALVRLRMPHHTGRYYRHDHKADEQPWVTVGYTSWRLPDWHRKFGKSFGVDGRKWEFYAVEEDIWEGYSDELPDDQQDQDK